MLVILVGAGAAMGSGVTALLLRRRRPAAAAGDVVATAAGADPVPWPTPMDAPDPPAAGARLDLSLRAVRAGLNLLSATVEAELTVINEGPDPAEEIRVGALLLSAHSGQDTELAAARAQPVVRPAVPPFTLGVGERRTMRIVVATPRDAIRAMTASGRPMFVPVVAVNCTYRTNETVARTAQAFAVGVERVDSAKLAPFWLDGPPRMHDQVAARPHATVSRS